jgi:hypothetical protein
MVDRIGTANVIITFKDYPIISSCIIVAWKTLDMGFAVAVRPNISKLENNVEILNDAASMITLYLLMAYQAASR